MLNLGCLLSLILERISGFKTLQSCIIWSNKYVNTSRYHVSKQKINAHVQTEWINKPTYTDFWAAQFFFFFVI